MKIKELVGFNNDLTIADRQLKISLSIILIDRAYLSSQWWHSLRVFASKTCRLQACRWFCRRTMPRAIMHPGQSGSVARRRLQVLSSIIIRVYHKEQVHIHCILSLLYCVSTIIKQYHQEKVNLLRCLAGSVEQAQRSRRSPTIQVIYDRTSHFCYN